MSLRMGLRLAFAGLALLSLGGIASARAHDFGAAGHERLFEGPRATLVQILQERERGIGRAEDRGPHR